MQFSGNYVHHLGALRFQPRYSKIYAFQLGSAFNLFLVYGPFSVFVSQSSHYPLWGNGIRVEVGQALRRGGLH